MVAWPDLCSSFEMCKSCSEVWGSLVDLVEDKLLANTCLSENGGENLLTSEVHKCRNVINIEIYSEPKTDLKHLEKVIKTKTLLL